jgi:TatD DNase family protein
VRLVDTHCHLNDTKAFPDPARTVSEAREVGIDRLVVVGTDEDSSRRALELADSFEGVFAVVGWHPTSAASYDRSRLSAIDEMLAHPKAVAVGEVGLDFYWDKSTPEEQYRCLDDHLELAGRAGKPVVLHCRDANDELLAHLEDGPALPYLFHCFSGDAGHARRAVELGAMLGVDGPITYSKNDALRSVFAEVPLDRVLVETDSPYLSPVPYRGQRNQPAWVVLVNRALAAVRGLSEEECAFATTANAERFFRL